MRPARIIALASLLSAAAVGASQHSIQYRRTANHLDRRLGPGIFGIGDDEDSSSASASASASASESAAASASSASASSESAASASRSSASASVSASRASASSAAAASSASEAADALASSQADFSRSLASASSVSASLSRASASSAATTSSASTTYITSTVQASSTPTPTAPQSSADAEDSASDSGPSKGLIIGISVAGGVLILAALVFLYLKFGGKRFSGFEDNDADIKWPELKSDPDSAAMQPLPARRTGGAGFDMGDDSDNGHEGSLKGRDSFAASTTALAAAPPSGFSVNDAHYPPIDQGYLPNPHQPVEPGHYYDMYPDSSAPAPATYHPSVQVAYPDTGVYPDANSYDPYATAGARPHHSQYI